MGRIKELDDFETGLNALVRFQKDGRRHVHEESRAIIRQVEKLLPSLANESFPFHEGSSLEYADRLQLYGNKVARLHHEVAGGDFVATSVLLMAARHGLKPESLKSAFHNLDKGRPHGLNVVGIYTQMQQFVRPEYMEPLLFPDRRPTRPSTTANVKAEDITNG